MVYYLITERLHPRIQNLEFAIPSNSMMNLYSKFLLLKVWRTIRMVGLTSLPLSLAQGVHIVLKDER